MDHYGYTFYFDEGGRWEICRLVVADTGSGISVQHIRHIFDRFYQIDVNHAGSGIGLAWQRLLSNCTVER